MTAETLAAPVKDISYNLSSFLARHGWGDSVREAVGADSSSRQYVRLRKGGRSVILMESAPDGSAGATPGHSMHDFIRIGDWLRGLGLHAPVIHEVDMDQGFMLMEDLGDLSFKGALQKKTAAPEEIYGLAVDALAKMQAAPCDLVLPAYYESHVHKGRRRIVDWYMPVLLGRRNEDGLAEDFLIVWDGIEKTLPPCPQGFLHIDYHVENLMWVGGSDQLRRCGVLDYQGAMRGPLPYDLANLSEDPRHDVPPELRDVMLARYCARMSAEEKETWMAWHRVLAAQFHCRVAGQFVRLAVRDGKLRYLEYLPRVCRYLTAGLEDPLLKPLKDWFADHGLKIRENAAPALKNAPRYIRPDAF